MSAAVVVLAAGAGARVGAGVNKVLLPLGDVTVLARSVRTVLGVPGLSHLVVVTAPDEREQVAALLGPELPVDAGPVVLLVAGGATRHASEANALAVLRSAVEDGTVDVVAVHDGARPLAAAALFTAVLEAAREHGGAIPGVLVSGLLARTGPAPAGRMMAVQTPQAFRAGPLLAAFDAAARDRFEATDTAGVLERYAGAGLRVVAVPGTPLNLKVTWADDLALALALLPGGA